MKYWLFTTPLLLTLAACSTSNESKQSADDTFGKHTEQQVSFAPLNTGGLTLLQEDSTYRLPETGKINYQPMDIRPPTSPIALINNSMTRFDGQRSLIVYPLDKQNVYSLKQVERLLREEGIGYTATSSQIETTWASTGRKDDIGNTQIRYLIEQVTTKDASALAVSILQMKRDNVIFTPTELDVQRYTSDRLNQLVGQLNAAYNKQQQELNSGVSIPIKSQLARDINGRLALGLDASFTYSWNKLRPALNLLGFKTSEENPAKGYRELSYSAPEATEWARFGSADPKLENGTYTMQLISLGRQSAVIISDEDNKTLPEEKVQHIYQALHNILAK
ncbi:outer membrane protein assembly factor BamC [Avibacterium avium]|uniref:outer membrane protein assembly factor BamC n=1 Tax=Avibacterium avium TaxID=751 RepID=UPI003BF7AACC